MSQNKELNCGALSWRPAEHRWLIGIRRDRMRLLARTACRTIRDIRARETDRGDAPGLPRRKIVLVWDIDRHAK
jgi:hypothetical protein